MHLPVTVKFDAGRVSQLPLILCRFSPNDSPPLSEGRVSILEVPIERGDSGALALSLDIEPVSVGQRKDGGLSLVVNDREAGSW